MTSASVATKLACRSRWITCEATGAGFRFEPRADQLLDFRADVRERADRARDLADAQVFGGGREARQVAAGLFVPDGELQAERDGLGVHAVRAADLHRVLELERAALQHLAQTLRGRASRIADACCSSSACAVSTTSLEVRP